MHQLNKMTSLELQEFLTRQKDSTSFSFTMIHPDETKEEIILKNNPKSDKFLKAHSEALFELNEASELI
ncbi:hypothetical protein SAMN04488700_0505 [Carnobacterium iners]|uniref:Uncharacterized protein n=1 Tax=Carnobacterium iners TaxID=1073423 RepID=A0A1X7MS73_9LACT|nr:hypothetical protein [Carnobacterium iners]SEL00903.1 hypothetical protein SAMN04488114_12022 [Carnobacterium iners]SMH27181.1 hypothetical protein SAMN04488700_0505 [Carnobacterium iners]